MKLNTPDFLHKCQHPLLLALGSIPVALLLVMNTAPALLSRMWLLLAAFLLLAWSCLLLPGKKRLLGGIAGAAALITLGVILLDVKAHMILLLLPLMYAALLFVTLPMGGWPRSRELHLAWYVVGMLLYVLLQLLVSGSRMAETYLYEPVILPITLGFLGFAALLLLALNRASLDSAAMSRRTVPLLMRRQNIVLTLALLLLALLIAAIPAIGFLLGQAWDWLMKGIGLLAAVLTALLPQKQQSGDAAPPPAGSDQLSLGEMQAPSSLALILEKVLGVIALFALIILIFFAGRALIKLLIRLVKYLWSRLNHYSAVASEDYEDEITDTRDEPDVERERLLHRLRRMGSSNEKGLSPTERVRYRYKRLKQKHTDWHAASTARETLPEQAAAIYERARYGGVTLTEEEADQFREGTKRV